jgi:hypothetical protein
VPAVITQKGAAVVKMELVIRPMAEGSQQIASGVVEFCRTRAAKQE